MSMTPKKSIIGSMERLLSIKLLIFSLSPDLYMACIWPHLACISRMPSSTLSSPDFVTFSSILVPSQPFFSLTVMSPCLSSLSSMAFSSSGGSLVVFCMRPNFVMPFRMASSTMISFETVGSSSRPSMRKTLQEPLKSLFNPRRPLLWPFGPGSDVGAAMQICLYPICCRRSGHPDTTTCTCRVRVGHRLQVPLVTKHSLGHGFGI